MLLPKKNIIYACKNNGLLQFFEEKPPVYEKEICNKEDFRVYLIEQHVAFPLIDEYIRQYFYRDVDNLEHLPWSSKPMERIQEKRFFEQNVERD